MAVTPLHAPIQGAGQSEKRFGRSSHIALALAVALVLLSAAQKVYRFTLPTEGWSTTTDFSTDAPIFVKNLLATPSALKAGDRLVAVEGVNILELQRQASRGQAAGLGYRAGETVRYTVLRGGEEVELEVYIYPGTSLGFGTLLRQLFSSNQVGNILLWVAVLLIAFVFWKRPDNPTAQPLLVMVAATTASAISWTMGPLSVADSLSPTTFYVAAFFSHWIHLTLEQPLALHVILSFPRPSALLGRRWLPGVLYGLPVAVMLSFILFPATGVLAFPLVALYNLLGIMFVVHMFFVRRNAVETVQVRWFGFGFALSNIGTLMFALSVAGVIPEHLASLSEVLPYNLVFLGCTAIAILRYRLFDIDIILNRTLVYGALTACVVGMYMLAVGGVGQLLQAQGNLGVSLFATGLVAVAFDPLRTRLQRGVNRLLYGERDEPYAVLRKLGQKIGGTLEPAKILPAITETVAQTLKLPYAGVVLTRDGAPELVASYGWQKGELVALPLVHQGERIGELRLEPRAGETFRPAELTLLRAIAQQASVAAYALRQSLALQRLLGTVVTAREEERLRIRRDLHDGLGPELASLTLKLDAARNVLYSQPERTALLLAELKSQTQGAISGIRRLVYDLRPPALDQLGLEGALREHSRACEGELEVEVRTVGDLSTLPAAAEVACYRIVLEALTNVVRHACATRCRIEVGVGAPARLELSVEDNGVGLPEEYQAGVGLKSMRERAEELGGTFSATRLIRGGTRVVATLPLPTR